MKNFAGEGEALHVAIEDEIEDEEDGGNEAHSAPGTRLTWARPLDVNKRES